MNAMSALYHIAQRDPPALGNTRPWSETFRDFVYCCLQKQSGNRPTSAQLLTHHFIKNAQTKGVLFDLVQRTKKTVEEMDNLTYRRMRKMLMKGSHEGTPDHTDGSMNAVAAMTDAGSTENVADSASGSPVEDVPSISTPHASESDSEESSNSEFSHSEVPIVIDGNMTPPSTLSGRESPHPIDRHSVISAPLPSLEDDHGRPAIQRRAVSMPKYTVRQNAIFVFSPHRFPPSVVTLQP
jgi:serine/threonine protein kinase